MLLCITIDDTKRDLEHLNQIIEGMTSVKLVGSFQDPLVAIAYMKKHPIDLLFSDIEMNESNGIELLKQVEHLPMLVFVSSHPKYAIDSFQLEPLHYIVKPATGEDVYTAVERALNREKSGLQNNYITLKESFNSYYKIHFSKLQFIESDGDYLKIHTNNKIHRILGRMKVFHTKLPDNFIRCHRSFIVNINCVSSLNNNKLLINEREIPISKLYRLNTTTKLRDF